METAQINKVAKQFDPPSDGKSGLYIYRNTAYGGAARTDVMVDGYCIGSSAPYVFFYEEVEGDKSYKVSTKFPWEESPDPDNDLLIKVKSGMHYFIHQYIKLGLFVGGAGIELVDEEQGKEEVSKLDMAKKGGFTYSVLNNAFGEAGFQIREIVYHWEGMGPAASFLEKLGFSGILKRRGLAPVIRLIAVKLTE